MATYVVRRLLEALGVIVAVTFVVFALLHLTGDPVRLMLPPEAPPQEVEALRRTLGLDVPLPVQYVRFLGGIFHGEFGRSLRYNTPSLPLVLERVPATLALATVATLLAVLVSVPLGVGAAVRPGSPVVRQRHAPALRPPGGHAGPLLPGADLAPRALGHAGDPERRLRALGAGE